MKLKSRGIININDRDNNIYENYYKIMCGK